MVATVATIFYLYKGFLFLHFLLDEANLLKDNLCIGLQFLDLLMHYINKARALLVRCTQESEVILVGLDFGLHSLVPQRLYAPSRQAEQEKAQPYPPF